MASAALGYPNRILTATLTTGSGTVANLQSPYAHSGASWQTGTGITSSAAGAWFVADAGSSVTWRAFGIFRTNLSASATVRWRVGSVAAMSSGVTYDSGALPNSVDPAYAQAVHVAPSTVSGRYLRCDIEDSAATGNFIRVGLAFGGPLVQPVVNIDPQSTFGSIAGERLVVTKGGGELLTPFWQARTATPSFSGLTEAEADAFRDLDLDARIGTNVLYIPDPNSAHLYREALFGRCKLASDVIYPQAGDARFGVRLALTERVG